MDLSDSQPAGWPWTGVPDRFNYRTGSTIGQVPALVKNWETSDRVLSRQKNLFPRRFRSVSRACDWLGNRNYTNLGLGTNHKPCKQNKISAGTDRSLSIIHGLKRRVCNNRPLVSHLRFLKCLLRIVLCYLQHHLLLVERIHSRMVAGARGKEHALSVPNVGAQRLHYRRGESYI